MSITYGTIKDNTLKLLDEYSSRSTVQVARNVKDYDYKIQSLVNSCLYDLATTTAKIPAQHKIAHNPISHRVSDDTSEIKTNIPGNDFSVSLTNARSCFFEATGPGTVVIEETHDGETYSTLETVTVSSTVTSFTEYRRLITPSDPTNVVRLRFTGDYVFSYRNYVLYPYSFPSESAVQQHRPFWEIDLPADFLDFNMVIALKNGLSTAYTHFNIIKNKFIFNAYDYPMELVINYWRKPNLLTFTNIEATDRALVIDLIDEATLIIPWYVAGEVFKSENKLTEGSILINQYYEKRENLIASRFERLNISSKRLYGW